MPGGEVGCMQTNESMRGVEPRCSLALLLGVGIGIAVMSFHPTGHDLLHGADRGAVIHRDQVVHAAAIASLLLQCFGLLGLVRRLRGARLGVPEFAMLLFGLATVAATVAAMASGFVAPGLLTDAEPPTAAWQWNHLLNQSFARLFVVTSTAAIVLWSVAGWHARMPRWLCGFGVVVPMLAMAMMLVGHLRLDVHGFFVIVLTQAVWLVGVAFELRRPPRA